MFNYIRRYQKKQPRGKAQRIYRVINEDSILGTAEAFAALKVSAGHESNTNPKMINEKRRRGRRIRARKKAKEMKNLGGGHGGRGQRGR